MSGEGGGLFDRLKTKMVGETGAKPAAPGKELDEQVRQLAQSDARDALHAMSSQGNSSPESQAAVTPVAGANETTTSGRGDEVVQNRIDAANAKQPSANEAVVKGVIQDARR